MSNPSLPPLPEPSWPRQELAEIASSAAAQLDASWVWVALSDKHHVIVPSIALKVEHDVPTAGDLQSTPDFVKSIIAHVANKSASLPEYAISDIHKQPALRVRVNADDAAIRALAAVRLVHDGQVVGALIIARDQPTQFTERHMQALRTCANQAATAMRQAMMMTSYQSQTRVLRALLGASQALTSSLDSREVFKAIIESIQGIIQFERALIYRYDERSQTLRVIAGMGEGADQRDGAVIPLDDAISIAAKVARDRLPLKDMLTPEQVAGSNTDALRRGKAVWLLCIPLISKGQLHGVASLARDFAFTQDEASSMSLLGPFAAAALENALLFQRVRTARQQQEAIFASASDGLAVVSDSMKLTQVNEAFARILGADPKQLVGQVCCQVFGAMRGPESSANCLLCAKHGRCYMAEAFALRQDREHIESVFSSFTPQDDQKGSYGPALSDKAVDFNVTFMPGPSGRGRLLLLGRDVSAQREVERIRSDYINMTTHEISNPLHAISNGLQDLLEGYADTLDDADSSMLQTSISSIYSISALMDDLALLSKRDARSWLVEVAPGDLLEEVSAAVAEQRFSARSKRVDLVMEPPAPLPPALIDNKRARQVARNLIGNAIKYTPRGGRVVVSVGYDANYVLLRVKDNGIGIPKEAQPRVWERNYRAPQPPGAPRQPGQGFGLAIVRIIMEAHNGDKWLESEPGKGSVFTVGFPRADSGRR